MKNNRSHNDRIKLTFVSFVAAILVGFTVACGSVFSSEPTKVPVTPINKQVFISVDTAPIRSLPDIDAQQVGFLNRGNEITVIGISTDGNWYLVDGSGIEGEAWILKEFVTIGTVQPEKTEAPTSTNTTVAIEKLTGTDTAIPPLTPSPTELIPTLGMNVLIDTPTRARTLVPIFTPTQTKTIVPRPTIVPPTNTGTLTPTNPPTIVPPTNTLTTTPPSQ